MLRWARCIVMIAGSVVLSAPIARAADSGYGELAAGALSVAEVSGVQCELCRDHLFDPARFSTRLPDGYRFVSAGDYAKGDSAVAAMLANDPRLASWAVGSLCFVLADTFRVDGVRAHARGPVAMAFWWAHAEATPEAAPDPRTQGRAEWLQLRSWYASRGTDRERIRTTDPMAEFVDIRVRRLGPNAWRLRLPLDGEEVQADVRGTGQRTKRKATGPGFMTVPFTGESADRFTVFTYFGHHHQPATGTWRAKGRGVFTSAFALAGEAEAFATFYQDRWQALSGLYRFGK